MSAGGKKQADVAQEAGGGGNKLTFAGLVALALSIGGNVVQWRTSTAALAKTRAEVENMEQAQREAATRQVQSWIDQVKKFDTVEDRVMVLSAAASTSPYESVQNWARDQLLRLDGELRDRKRAAEQKVALVERTTVPVTLAGIGLIGTGAGTGGGSGISVVPRDLRPLSGGPVPATTGSGSAVLMPPSELVAVARKDLARVTAAEQILRSAKIGVRPPLTPPPGADP